MLTEDLVHEETDITEKPRCLDEDFELVYKKPGTLLDISMHYCPGCAHSLVHKLIMEVV